MGELFWTVCIVNLVYLAGNFSAQFHRGLFVVVLPNASHLFETKGRRVVHHAQFLTPEVLFVYMFCAGY